MRRLYLSFIAVLWSCAVALSPAAAQTSAPSPEALAAAKELVTAARATDQFKAILPMLTTQLKPVIAQGRPDVEKDYDAIMPMISEAFLNDSNKLLDEIATIYANNFTVEQMKQITAFYGTPAGQALLEKLPVVMQQSMTAGQKFGQQLVQNLRTRIMDELRKRGHKI